MKLWIYAAVFLGGMFSCADEHSRHSDAGACTNESECLCNDGRNGTKVCDLDTGELVMCQCAQGGGPRQADAGTKLDADAAASSSGRAAPVSPMEAGRQAAGRDATAGTHAAVGGMSDGASAAGAESRATPSAKPGKGKGRKAGAK